LPNSDFSSRTDFRGDLFTGLATGSLCVTNFLSLDYAKENLSAQVAGKIVTCASLKFCSNSLFQLVKEIESWPKLFRIRQHLIRERALSTFFEGVARDAMQNSHRQQRIFRKCSSGLKTLTLGSTQARMKRHKIKVLRNSGKDYKQSAQAIHSASIALFTLYS
jgi:hypothetical protein